MILPSAPELARRLADVLEAASVPYAIGGALALGVWGFPRATNDVDLDLFVAPEDLGPVIERLRAEGFDLDPTSTLRDAAERGDFSFRHQRMRVDVFVPSIPFYEQCRDRVRRAPLEGRPAWFLTPEDLAIFKMFFFRTKDLLDIERLVAVQGESFDDAYVRRTLVEYLGALDERVTRWDQLVRETRSTR